ncbi:MAG: cobalamin B12-binding domain-containing protein [Candidatus Aenigmarchaeota archaeon]|nr:cobalamin B12-binding domain-containing protein [Candidatus Aenigmarchaeota archaeon]
MKKKIVLFNPAGTHDDLKLRHTPVSLLAVSKLLYKDGYDIKIVSRYESGYIEKILNELEDAVCIGITAMTGYQIRNALEVASAIRAKFPDIKIVWGGWHASILPEQTIRYELVDIIVCGQGERTFYELVEALRNNKPLKNVKGIFYKEGAEIKRTPMRELESIENFPPRTFRHCHMGCSISRSLI